MIWSSETWRADRVGAVVLLNGTPSVENKTDIGSSSRQESGVASVRSCFSFWNGELFHESVSQFTPSSPAPVSHSPSREPGRKSSCVRISPSSSLPTVTQTGNRTVRMEIPTLTLKIKKPKPVSKSGFGLISQPKERLFTKCLELASHRPP